MSALDEFIELRGKQFADRTNIERVIVLLWQEINGYESICIKAAGELAALKARIAELEEYIDKHNRSALDEKVRS